MKDSAASKRGAGLAHLRSAELRGVVAAALDASGANVIMVNKGVVSKTFGERKVDEYVADNAFWRGRITGSLRKGSREAAFLTIVAEEE